MHAARIRNQISRTLIACGIIFFACQSPYRIAKLDFLLDDLELSIFDDELFNTLLSLGQVLILLNSAINPYLYGLTCKHYRHAIIKAIRRCRPSLITPNA